MKITHAGILSRETSARSGISGSLGTSCELTASYALQPARWNYLDLSDNITVGKRFLIYYWFRNDLRVDRIYRVRN